MKALQSLVATVLIVLTSAISVNAQEQSQCGPVTNGWVINYAFECFNDSVFMTVDSSKLDQFGWYYTDDGLDDEIGDAFNIHGMAFRETDDEIWLVISTDLSLLAGSYDPDALGGRVGYGDIFINLSGLDFLGASNSSALYALHFDPFNDSPLGDTLGLYSAVNAVAKGGANRGFDRRVDYELAVANRGGTVDYGDFPPSMTYFPYDLPNSAFALIDTGTYLGPVSFVSTAELAAAGYDTSRFGGVYTVALRFDKSLIIDRCGVVGGDGTSCLDCAGVPCGDAVVDECGVCGGDGTSCGGCVETDYTAVVETLTTRIKEQRRFYRRLLRKYGKGNCKPKKANKSYRSMVSSLETIPLQVTTCSENPFCTDQNINSETVNILSGSSDTLYTQSRCIIKNWSKRALKSGSCNGPGCKKRVKSRRRLKKKLLTRALEIHETVMELVNQVPLVESQCEE
ncbi:MAG: hypothetical protein D6719_11925 [Candidatus Dadabacteria bacterium]|nr:MAG: hypothetical protein D6719_11925 [Candidatus Dadabacteria bacterium]